MNNKPDNLNWYGMLTIENIEEVVKLFEKLLKGKKYTFTAVNEFFRYKPEVRTSQRLEGKPSVWKKDSYAGFNFSDSYGVWGCSTSLSTEQYDPEFNNPYIVFEWNKATITHRAPAGHLLYWTVAVEK